MDKYYSISKDEPRKWLTDNYGIIDEPLLKKGSKMIIEGEQTRLEVNNGELYTFRDGELVSVEPLESFED